MFGSPYLFVKPLSNYFFNIALCGLNASVIYFFVPMRGDIETM